MSDQVITPVARAGLSIPDYELLRPIGRGAYGEVWLARNVTGSWVALKIVQRAAFDHDRPFEREFEGIKRFEPISRSDPSQVAILHVGLGEGFFYYVMELADDVAADVRRLTSNSEIRNPKSEIGQSLLTSAATYQPKTLKRLLNDRGALPAQECLTIALSLTRALAHLHGHGLVHRDVKPSNVIFVNGQAKLADIGLVTSVDATRSFVGTEGYLPPEGAGTPQADIYSLGKVLYEMSTGCDRKEFPALPPDIATRPDRDTLAELNAIVVRACQLDPRERYVSAEAMRADLERLVVGKSVRRAHQTARRWRLAQRGVGWLAVSVVALTLIVLASRVRPPPANQENVKRSTNEVANRFYVRGRHSFEKNTAKDLEEAATNFDQAMEADPRFAQAYAARALTYAWAMDGWNLLPKGKAVALKALELDDSLGDPHIVLGLFDVMREWNWKEAEQEFKRAIHLNPSGAIGYHFYAEFLRMTGRTNESVKTMTQALRLEPGSVPINRRFTDHLVAARRYEEAIQHADLAIAMERDTPTPQHKFRIRALCALGRYDEAIETERNYRLLKGDLAGQVDAGIRKLKEAFAVKEAAGYWRRQLEVAEQSDESDGFLFYRAGLYAQLGETQQAIDFLRAAVKERDVWLTFYVMTDWTLDPLRSDPDFHAILQEMHLE